MKVYLAIFTFFWVVKVFHLITATFMVHGYDDDDGKEDGPDYYVTRNGMGPIGVVWWEWRFRCCACLHVERLRQSHDLVAMTGMSDKAARLRLPHAP